MRLVRDRESDKFKGGYMRCWVWGTGYEVLGMRYWVWGTGYGVLGMRYWVWGTGYEVLITVLSTHKFTLDKCSTRA